MRIRGAITICVLAAGWAAAPAAETAGKAFQTDRVDRAVDRAVKFLVAKQDLQSGYICDKQDNRLEMTSLAVLAMAAGGHQSTDATPAGRAMKRALRYVLQPAMQSDDGGFGEPGGSKRMYGQGIVTLMLAEMLGESADDSMDQLIRRRCKKSIELILRSQQLKRDQAKGGWRYTADGRDADISVTVWLLLALRSARNAGLRVPSQAIDDARAYVKRCYVSETDAGGNPLRPKTGFGYTPGSAKYMSASTTAMGLLSLQLCGEYDSPFCRGSADWLLDNPPTWGARWLFYGTYYYSQGMFQAGGKHAEKARQVVYKLLLPEQRPNGCWEGSSSPEREAGLVYTTSLAVLALSVKYHYLPIYQR